MFIEILFCTDNAKETPPFPAVFFL